MTNSASDLQRSTKRERNPFRTATIFTAIVVGAVEVVGYFRWAMFAGSYGGGGVKLQGGIT